MAIGDDFSIAANGDIRYTGTTTNYTVIDFHRWLGDLLDDASYSGNDRADITINTISERSTDNIITLNSPYNIDDIAARHLYDGSIRQNNGDDLYSGLVVVGSVETGTELQVVQNNKMLYQFWGTGINVDAANNIITRMMIKTRSGGYDIDAKKVRVFARELGDTYGEFLVTMGLGNSTAAIFTNQDLNNGTANTTIEGWTTISNTEGLRLLDIDNDTVNEEYYSEWNIGSQTINDTYERAKWITQRSEAEDSNAETGNNFSLGNGTLIGQAQSFANGPNAKKITKARFRLKKVGSPTGTLNAILYAHSGSFGSSSIPTGAALATSEGFDVSVLTTSYQEIELLFYDAQQASMTASTNYVIAVEYSGGDGSNYVDVEGDTTGTHAGNQSDLTGTTWTAAAAEDLWFEVYAGYEIHAMSGELFRGITHNWAYDTEVSGPFTEDAVLAWGTSFDYTGESGGPFQVGENILFATSGAKGVLRYLDDQGTTGTVVVAVESGTVQTSETFTGQTSGASATTDATTINDPAAVGGTAQILALDDDGTTGNLYVQLLTGSPPVNNLITYQVGGLQNALVNGSVTQRTVSQPFIGTSTGSNLIGAYGIGFEPADVSASDTFFDLSNSQVNPPNNVTWTLNGLVSGDRALVAPLGYSFAYDNEAGGPFTVGENLSMTTPTGTAVLVDLVDEGTTGRMIIRMLTGDIPTDNTAISGDTSTATANVDGDVDPDVDVRQMTLNGTLSGTAVTSVVVNGSIPTDTPSTGTIRIERDSGVYSRHPYSAYTGSTFTITSHDFSTDNATTGNNTYVSYIDIATASTSENFTSVYSSDRSLFVRVRDGGATPIKTFQTTSTLTNAGGQVTAIRTTDA
ncbi:MAG: hypothetical protein R3268_00120 [Acidiferrobacterales bacterium]|nr:hypothetical protein [Acidiferrobacterales bacterium]